MFKKFPIVDNELPWIYLRLHAEFGATGLRGLRTYLVPHTHRHSQTSLQLFIWLMASLRAFGHYCSAVLLVVKLQSMKHLFMPPTTSVGRGHYKMTAGICLSICLSVCRIPWLNSRTEKEAQNWQEGSPSHRCTDVCTTRPLSTGRLLHTSLRHCQQTTFAFCQSTSPDSTMSPAQYFWSSGLLYRRSDGLEFTTR